MKCLRGSLRPTHARTTPRCAAQRRSSIRRRAQSDDDTRGAHVEMSEYVSSFTSDEAVALRASLERPRCDVFDPSIHLRAMLPSRYGLQRNRGAPFIHLSHRISAGRTRGVTGCRASCVLCASSLGL